MYLYPTIKTNSLFLLANRGTNTEKRFVADVENSDYEHGFYINNGSEKLIVTESVIDAMSIMSILKAKGIDYKSYDYLPLAGAAKFESLMNLYMTM